MYRNVGQGLEVLLVHPGGPYWAKKYWHCWSIPKGEIAPGESPFAAALREFEEETGLVPKGDFQPLTPVRQGGGKLVQAWAFQGNAEPAALPTHTFSMEWPPHSGRRQEFPEVDAVRWLPLVEARRRIVKAQILFLDQLSARPCPPADNRAAPAMGWQGVWHN